MKRPLTVVAVGGVMLVIGLFAGAFFQNARSGYHFRLLEERDYASTLGTVKWSCFTETVGFPFLDPEKTMISVGNRTIYKAQRDFQENDPHARNIETSGNSISWEDGDYRYHLTMQEVTNGEPVGASNRSQPSRSETNSTSVAAGSDR
ncbi:MAG: hypothetical protein FJ405_06270 [Verrucomicrobia bacterium]|nr:hypothetical protein [Verrucomicrobiota bacterium]